MTECNHRRLELLSLSKLASKLMQFDSGLKAIHTKPYKPYNKLIVVYHNYILAQTENIQTCTVESTCAHGHNVCQLSICWSGMVGFRIKIIGYRDLSGLARKTHSYI